MTNWQNEIKMMHDAEARANDNKIYSFASIIFACGTAFGAILVLTFLGY